MGGLRVALAVNPSSGQGRGGRAGEITAEQLRAAGFEVDMLIGKDAADLAGQVQHALAPLHQLNPAPGHQPVQALVVAGGDGMVQLGVTALAKTGWPAPLGIVPAGTGNDVARALRLPIGDVTAAAASVVRWLSDPAARRQIDAVRCTPVRRDSGRDPLDDPGDEERWFTGVLGAGFDAVVNERANHWTRPRGRAKYVLAMLRELPGFRPRKYVLTLDGETWRTAAMLVAVANAPSYGGGMRVCPDAQLDDGLLDVLVVHPLTKPAFLRIFPRVYSGTHVSDARVEIRRAREVLVEAAGIVGYADGERFGALPLRCELMPGALGVLSG